MLIRSVFLICACLSFAACQTMTGPVGGTIPQANNPQALLAQAKRTQDTDTAIELTVAAAQLYNAQGQYNEALAAMTQLDTLNLSAAQRAKLARPKANAYFGLKQYQAAEAALADIRNWQGDDQYLLGEICAELGNYRCSADAYIQAGIELGLDSDILPADLHDRIWLALSRARETTSAFTHRYHQGWWLLQEQLRTAGSISNQIAAWQNWQSSYPSHPARIRPPEALRKLDAYETPQVGIFLPLSGRYGAAGRAVRDGIVAAYLSEPGSNKSDTRFYDTGEADLAALYEQALREGADVLLGPLIRSEVERFSEITQFAQVPRLVLNYLNDLDEPIVATGSPFNRQTSSLFQFGIAIEDEAISLSDHVLLQGSQHLLIVHNEQRWAQRALAAYTDAWPFATTTASFFDIKNVTQAVGEAMQVAASESRRNDIARIIGQPLEFLPRARGDLDGVVAFTDHVEARALVPALKFHFADQLPVYATSQVARGNNLKTLAGFEITEMPLFVEPTEKQQTLVNAFGLRDTSLGELYALGYDAYRLATWLPILDANSQVAVPAATGYLWLEDGGRFRRELSISHIDQDGQISPAR